jgi:hypothetical protein
MSVGKKDFCLVFSAAGISLISPSNIHFYHMANKRGIFILWLEEKLPGLGPGSGVANKVGLFLPICELYVIQPGLKGCVIGLVIHLESHIQLIY